MADERTYIRVHDGMPDHWKIEALSDRAFRLLVTTWCWCSRHLNDGHFPESSWKRRGTPKARKELQDAGLVEVNDGRVVMHDYLEHQRSSGQVGEIREKKRRAAALANHTRWHLGRSRVDPKCELCNPDGIAGAIGGGSQVDRTTDNGRNPSEAEAEAEKKGSGRPGGATPDPAARDAKRGAKRGDPRPDPDDEPPRGPGITGPHAASAKRLVQRIIGHEYPAAVRTDLSIRVAELRRQYDESVVEAALTEWRSRTGIGPGVLPSLVADQVKHQNGHAKGNATRPSTTDERVAAAQALKAYYADESDASPRTFGEITAGGRS